MKKVLVFSLLTTYLLAGEAVVFEDTPVLDGKHSTKAIKAKVYSSNKQDAFSKKLYNRYKKHFNKKSSHKSYKKSYKTSSHNDAIIAHDELVLPEEY